MEEQRQGRWREVRIYLDSYMATSFWMHLLCLSLTDMILRYRNGRRRKKRIIFSALFCTAFDTVMMILFLDGNVGGASLRETGLALVGLLTGAGVAYGIRKIISGGLVLLGVTALLAGILQILPIQNAGLFCLVGLVLFSGLSRGIHALFRTKQTQKFLYEAWLYQGEEGKGLSAFLDTGNRLRLPGSTMPVVLVDRMYLTDWIETAKNTMPQRLVFLPYKGVGGRGILHGVRLRCTLQLENGDVCSGEVAAVAAEHSLFQGCDYQMILQPEVLTLECVLNTREGEQNVI